MKRFNQESTFMANSSV